MLASPTTASDVYTFGVVVLKVACGWKPIQTWQETEEDVIFVDFGQRRSRAFRAKTGFVSSSSRKRNIRLFFFSAAFSLYILSQIHTRFFLSIPSSIVKGIGCHW
ncbi:hypothetical protein L2E82_35907 [Cichorium intybus]|uniref:Uncharacterized protein n=1 Tax=Cichorium intybus TaxID=13427 RepID=A0ACB9BQ58_CICIN|nr:hypothetical protein L2E82_35907 [Cichorium intybus]